MAESDEVLEVKRRARRRLIGAVALVLFLVIVPPWLMDLEPRPVTPNLSVEMPGKDQPKLEPPAAPAESAAKAESVPSKEAAPEVVRPAPKAEPVTRQPSPEPAKQPSADQTRQASADPKGAVAKDSASKEVKAGAKPAPAPSDDGQRAAAILKNESYFVPLGAFNNAENAKQIQAKAAGTGAKVFVEQVDVKGEIQTRVRAGPYPSREAAEAAREKLKGAGLDPGPVRTR